MVTANKMLMNRTVLPFCAVFILVGDGVTALIHYLVVYTVYCIVCEWLRQLNINEVEECSRNTHIHWIRQFRDCMMHRDMPDFLG